MTGCEVRGCDVGVMFSGIVIFDVRFGDAKLGAEGARKPFQNFQAFERYWCLLSKHCDGRGWMCLCDIHGDQGFIQFGLIEMQIFVLV